MIRATARVLRNVIEVQVASETWIAKPVAGTTTPVARQIALLFSTVYETFRPGAPEVVHSTVSYHAKKDEIILQVGESRWKTHSTAFGPMSFEYGGSKYEVHEKITGKFGVFLNDAVVAPGQLGFRSCELREYPAELEPILANFALGYLIRNLFWEMLR